MNISTSSELLPDTEKLGYTVPEACAVTGLSRSLLYKLMKGGEIPFRKVRSRTLLLRRDLEAFLENQPTGAA
jgi:excisionase family DNA binding protein